MKRFLLFLWIASVGKCFSQVDFQNLKSIAEEKSQKQVTDLATASEEDILNYQQKLTADLAEKGSIVISAQEAGYLKNLNFPEPQKEIVGNLYIVIPGNNVPVSFQYNVNAGDTFYFSLANRKRKKIFSLEVVEGEEVRYLAKNITKKEPIESSFQVQRDGIVSINLTNKYFLKAAGQLMVWIKKKKPEVEVSLKRDTIIELQPGTVYLSDTLFVPMLDEQLLIHSKLDLSHSNKYQKALNIPVVENLVGWIFWIGETKAALDRLNHLQEQLGMDPLAAYALDKTFALPTLDNLDVSWVIQDKALGDAFLKGNRSVPNRFDVYKGDPGGNYGFVNASFPEGVFFTCINQSNLYDYYVGLKITGMVINKKEDEGEIEVPIVNEYYEITIK